MTDDEEIMGSSLGFATLRGLLTSDASRIGRMSTKHSAASQRRALMGVSLAVVRGMREVNLPRASW